jgi:hypothetical protein
MLEYWNDGMLREKMASNLEGRALSRPATTERGPPKICIPHHSIVPLFQHSSEVGKHALCMNSQ